MSVSKQRMLDILGAVWKDCYQKEFEEIHAAIIAYGGYDNMRKDRDAWRKRAMSGLREILDLRQKVRDFEEEGKK